jgi:phosphatidylcholine synthase
MDPFKPPEPGPHAAQRHAAFAVHIFTASGAACALMALMAAVKADYAPMFGWLGVALIVDGIDGSFARRLRVAEMLPRWSGEMLDFVVDYATYVFVPAYAIAASALFPAALALALGVVVAVSGALYFADRSMKTADSYFRGFPALWNIAAFYLFLLRPPFWAGAVMILSLAAASFAPILFVHPVRVRRWRTANLIAAALWALLAIAAIAINLDPPVWVTAALCIIAIYFVIVGLIQTAR